MKPNGKVLPIFLVANLRWQSVSRKINYTTDCLQKVSNLFYFCENNHLRVIYCVLCEWSIFILSFIYSILCTFCGTWRNVKIYFLKNEQMNSFLSSFSETSTIPKKAAFLLSQRDQWAAVPHQEEWWGHRLANTEMLHYYMSIMCSFVYCSAHY